MFSIAIDGPAGAGKSTVAKRLAADCQMIYVDTGAMYRTIGYYILQQGLNPKNPEDVIPQLPNIHIGISYSQEGGQRISLNGKDVSQEIRLPEIALLDKDGKRRSLSEVTDQGKVVVLNFTAYGAEASPAFNLELAKVYDAHKAEGLEIYQVSVDDDEFLWKQAARNLPWITVYNTPKDGAETLLKYNVGQIPATYVINRNGELVERVPDVTKLETTVRRYL